MDQDTALSVTSVTMSEFSGVKNNIQLEISHQHSVETHTNINESSNTETNNTEEDDTFDTPIVNITEGIYVYNYSYL
ncbi:hypothetical protein QTP88_019399 [Uroleucon formosanum]